MIEATESLVKTASSDLALCVSSNSIQRSTLVNLSIHCLVLYFLFFKGPTQKKSFEATNGKGALPL